MNVRVTLSQVLAKSWWVGVGLLLVLVAAGCLTSRAKSSPPQAPQPENRVYQEDTATASATATSVMTPTATLTATATANVTATATSAISPTATPEVTATATPTPTATALSATATATLEETETVPPEPTDTPIPTSTSLPEPTSIPPTLAPFRAWAWVDNWYPSAGDVVTVYGRLYRYGKPACGAQMGATWRYTCGEAYCTAYTGLDGIAACTINIGCPLPNFWVPIDIVFIHEGETFYAQTGFLMDP